MTSAMPVRHQLSYEATQLGAGQFVGLICSGDGLDECNERTFEKGGCRRIPLEPPNRNVEMLKY